MVNVSVMEKYVSWITKNSLGHAGPPAKGNDFRQVLTVWEKVFCVGGLSYLWSFSLLILGDIVVMLSVRSTLRL